MQIKALKMFCDVAREGSFSEAARINKRTQSAISQIVRQLEKRLGGVELFDRSERPLKLTEPGRTYYEGCKRMLEQYLELEASIKHAQFSAAVQVAAIYSVGLGDMGQYVERCRSEQPNAQIHIEYLHPDRVYEKVFDGTADFGLVSFPRKPRALTCLPWREEEMVLACSPTHSLARCLFVRPGQLAGEKYIGFDKGLVIRKKVDQFLREQGVMVNVAMEFDNIENIKKAIDEAAGVALLPEPTLRREVQAKTLAAIPLYGCRFVRPLGIIKRRHHKLSSTAQRFLNLLRQPAENASSGNDQAGPSVNGAHRSAHDARANSAR